MTPHPIRHMDFDGTVYSMWRCSTCGEMGRLQRTLPASCPACGAAREAIFYWAED